MSEYKRVLKVEEVQEGRITPAKTKFISLGLTKIGGEILAFEDVCTHDGGSIVRGEYCDGILTCPRHHAKFDMQTGEALCLPAVEPIPFFPTRVVDGFIEVELED